ncbi:MAG: O-antigen ligase family protein, partial [Oscillospiraceae bacterium]
METVKQSLVCSILIRFCYTVYHLWEGSVARRVVRGFTAWCDAVWHHSVLIGFLTREGTLPRAWRDSGSCRLLTAVINLPVTLLHKLYMAGQALFDDSFFARLAFDMGENTAVAISWLMALLLSIPFERWNNAYSLLGFVLCLLLFFAGGMRRKTLRLDVAAIGPYPVLLAATVALAVPLSAYPGLSGRFLLYHLTCMLCVVVTVSAVRHTEDLVRLAGGAAIGVLTSSAYAFLQRIQGVEVNESYVDMTLNAGMPGRVFSFFDNPNAFAEVLIFLLPLVVALVLCSKRWYSRLAAAGIFALGVGALLMTYSRASWVGLALSAAVFVFLWNPKLIPGLVLLAVVAVPFLPDTILNRILTITNLNDSSTSSRFPLYEAAINLIQERPVTGAGLGTDAVRQFIKSNNLYHARAPFVHAHNIYLQIWGELGIVGLLSFVATLLWGYQSAAAAVKHTRSRAARLITIGGASAIAGAMVCGLADYLWNYPRVMCVFWFLFAVTAAGIKVCKLER